MELALAIWNLPLGKMPEKPGKMARNLLSQPLEPLWFIATYDAEQDSGRNRP
jgi:hypothetical protein